MFNEFSEEARKIMVSAKEEMYSLKHPYVGSEHLLLAILKNDNDVSKKLKESKLTYDTFKNSELENGTIEILKDGLYYVGVMGYYKITGATANKRILFRVMPNNFNNDQLNRIISYYNGSDSVVNINGGQVLYLKKGDVLTVDLYFDSTTGTISELEAPQIRLCLINDLY